MISVIGHKGVVGSATYRLFKSLGYDVIGLDIGDEIKQSAIYFVCIPEGEVEGLVVGLPPGLIVIRSSVPPLTCETLSMRHGRHICHNPEFLHQATALIDEFSPDSVVIGECCKDHGNVIESLYRPLLRPVVRTTPRISEMVKLARNNYGATVISFWNEIERICEQAGINGHQVGMICSLDPIICAKGSRLHKEYGGACLPKDIDQTIKFAKSIGIIPKLLEAVKRVNDDLSK